MKHYKHKSTVPACCNTCFYVRKPKQRHDYRRCSLGIAMPVKKGSCAKYHDSIAYVFHNFLKSNGVLEEYKTLLNDPDSVKWREGKTKYRNPLFFIFRAFPWPDDDENKWYSLDQDWEDLLESRFKQEDGKWLPK